MTAVIKQSSANTVRLTNIIWKLNILSIWAAAEAQSKKKCSRRQLYGTRAAYKLKWDIPSAS